MASQIGITLDGEMKNYILEKFTFKLDQTKNAMVFGSTGIFSNSMVELDTNGAWPSQESWYANDQFSMTYFDRGKLLYTLNTLSITSASADCEKF